MDTTEETCGECTNGWVHSREPFEIQACGTCQVIKGDENAALAHEKECGCDWPEFDIQNAVWRWSHIDGRALNSYFGLPLHSRVWAHLKLIHVLSKHRDQFLNNLDALLTEVGLLVVESFRAEPVEGVDETEMGDRLGNLVGALSAQLLRGKALASRGDVRWLATYEDGDEVNGKWFVNQAHGLLVRLKPARRRDPFKLEPIQGSAADVAPPDDEFLKKLGELQGQLTALGATWANNHDEIRYSIPEDKMEEAKPIVEKVMALRLEMSMRSLVKLGSFKVPLDVTSQETWEDRIGKDVADVLTRNAPKLAAAIEAAKNPKPELQHKKIYAALREAAGDLKFLGVEYNVALIEEAMQHLLEIHPDAAFDGKKK